MKTISEVLGGVAVELIKNSIHATKISTENVYQPANLKNRRLVHNFLQTYIKPQSLIVNEDKLVELGQLSRSGKSCLILMEHYSNFDIPSFFYLMEQEKSKSKDVAQQIIAMAGMKLNEDESLVRGFTEAYTRIVIYPSRSIEKVSVMPGSEEEIVRARSINRAALHAMVRKKNEGNIVLVFPAGTRYRPGDESTRRGLREIDSYMKSFEHILFIAIAGNCLTVRSDGDKMSEDYVQEDVMVFHCDDKIQGSKQFRDSIIPKMGEDPKQAVSDAVMARLAMLNQKANTIQSALKG